MTFTFNNQIFSPLLLSSAQTSANSLLLLLYSFVLISYFIPFTFTEVSLLCSPILSSPSPSLLSFLFSLFVRFLSLCSLSLCLFPFPIAWSVLCCSGLPCSFAYLFGSPSCLQHLLHLSSVSFSLPFVLTLNLSLLSLLLSPLLYFFLEGLEILPPPNSFFISVLLSLSHPMRSTPVLLIALVSLSLLSLTPLHSHQHFYIYDFPLSLLLPSILSPLYFPHYDVLSLSGPFLSLCPRLTAATRPKVFPVMGASRQQVRNPF